MIKKRKKIKMEGRKRKVWEEKESEESDKGKWKYGCAKYIEEQII